MKKAATVLLWTSFGINVLYLILAIAISVFVGNFNSIEAADGMTYTIAMLYYLICGGIPLIVQFVMMIIILFGLKGHSENIVAEIITIIMFSGIGSLAQYGVSAIANMVMGVIGSMQLAVYAQMISYSGWVSCLRGISFALLLVATAFAIAYKKVEMVDIRRLQQEEENDWK